MVIKRNPGNSTLVQVAVFFSENAIIIDQASLRNAARGSKEELLLSLSSVHEDSSETE